MTDEASFEDQELFDWIREFEDKPENGGGGNLHIILEDQNCETDHIEWCLDRCNEKGDTLGAKICDRLLELPFNRRMRAAETAPYVDLAQPPHWVRVGPSMTRTGQDGGGALVNMHDGCVARLYPDEGDTEECSVQLSRDDLHAIMHAHLWHERDLARRRGLWVGQQGGLEA